MKDLLHPFKDDIENLNVLPHTLPQLIDMILDKQQLSADWEQHVWNHLTNCIHCQAFLGSYMLKVIEYEKEYGESEESARELLTKLTHIMHETLRSDIPAYIDTLEEYGRAPANRRFPQFAEHMHVCKDCQAAVQNVYEWVSQSGL